jgi:hypothetical protein
MNHLSKRCSSRLALALIVLAGACGDNLGVGDVDGGHDGSVVTMDAPASSQAPVVTFTSPANGSSGAAINVRVTVAFDLPMQALTASTFTLAQGATPITGAVANSGGGLSATFTPGANLAPNTLYTATITTGARSAAGTALAASYSWMFTTGSSVAMGPPSVSLGNAASYTILSKTAISTVPMSVITGDIGVSPAAATFITGFDLALDATTTFSTSTQVVGGGRVYAASYAAPTPALITAAIGSLEGAYTDAASRSNPDFLELASGNLGGLTLVPGLYTWTSDVSIPTDVTIAGGANDVWIFQTTGNLTMTANMHVILAGQAQAKNIFWQIAGTVSTGAGAHFEGILLCKTVVTLQTGTTMNGRVLAQTQVALQSATVTPPAP